MRRPQRDYHAATVVDFLTAVLSRDSSRRTFLATEDVHFVRNVLTPTPVEKLDSREKLRILIAVAEPIDLAPISAADEAAKLEHSLRSLIDKGLIELDIVQETTAKELHEKIALNDYDVFHFIGHGFWERDDGMSGLVLEDAARSATGFGGRSLREVLSGRQMRLVFLNACNTGSGVVSGFSMSTDSMAGAAQDLFGRGVPNVIANQFAVGDAAAVEFARSVDTYLAHGKPVADSVREARIAASYVAAAQPLDWAVPVLYARDPEDRLVCT